MRSLVLSVVTLFSVAVAPTAAAAGRAPGSDLRAAVRAAVVTGAPGAAATDRAMPGRVLVEPKRSAPGGGWVFGGAVQAATDVAGPRPVLFLARRDRGRWRVALAGTAGFPAQAAAVPPEVLGPDERDALAGVPESGSARTGLALPWSTGKAWRHAGVHGDRGTSRPFNAIDFYGGSGKVRASASGRVYHLCTGRRWPLVMIVHANGLSTTYYHLRHVPRRADGTRVATGQFLGRTGTEVPCGGRASAPHVHWALWRGEAGVAVDGRRIGGWIWQQGARARRGYAQRGKAKVYTGQCCALVNYGRS